MGPSAVLSRPLDRAIDQLLAEQPGAALAELLPVIEARPDAAALVLAWTPTKRQRCCKSRRTSR
jgi:hypothetical protein